MSIQYQLFSKRLIWLIYGVLTGTTTPGQSRYGSNGKEEVTLHSIEIQNWSLTTRYIFVSYRGIAGGSFFFFLFRQELCPSARDAVSLFQAPQTGTAILKEINNSTEDDCKHFHAVLFLSRPILYRNSSHIPFAYQQLVSVSSTKIYQLLYRFRPIEKLGGIFLWHCKQYF